MRQVATIFVERGTDLADEESGAHTKAYIGNRLLVVRWRKEINEMIARSGVRNIKEE